MNAQQFGNTLQAKTNRLKQYAKDEFPAMAARKTLRFINGNFRAQGWQGSTFQKWPANKRKGTILVKKGHLRRSFRQQVGPGMVRTFSTSSYAAVHNRGFNGTVNVQAHERRTYTARKIGTGRFTQSGKERTRTVHEHTGTAQVKAHTRRMNIPKRQFMPEKASDSPILVNSIRKEVIKTIKSIFE